MKLQVKRISEKAELPRYQTDGAVGFDLHSTENVIIDRDCTVVVGTGLKVKVPEGYEMQIRPRSGLSVDTKLRVANAPGTIDNDYRGEVGVILYNAGNRAEQIEEGDRIAQAVITPVVKVEMEEVDELEETERAEAGFGSTGR